MRIRPLKEHWRWFLVELLLKWAYAKVPPPCYNDAELFNHPDNIESLKRLDCRRAIEAALRCLPDDARIEDQ